MEDEKSKMELLKSKVEESQYIPTGISTLRAGVSAIPFVGGALDHLLFDKSDVIKSRNIQKSIDDITRKIASISQENLTKDWFESTEALEMFRQLIDKVQFEADDRKIKTIADIYAVSGSQEFSSDPNKFAILRKASELSTVQKELLLIISNVPRAKRNFSSGGFQSSQNAIWFDDIRHAVEMNPKGKFWNGVLQLNIEIEIIESLNLIHKTSEWIANLNGYELTALGKLLVIYLKS